LQSSLRGTGPWALITGAAAVVVLLVATYMAFLYAPTDAIQGNAQRIFYVHVPTAWLSYLAYFVLVVGSVGYLWKRKPGYDRIARSAAELGFVFTTMVLITGSIWGRPIWGTWWQWEARLTTTLILWFIYLGYFMVRNFAGEHERAARFAAVLAIIGAIDIPIIHMSVRWWRTLHPEPIVVNTGGPNLPDSMLLTLMVSFVGFTILFAHLMIQKWNIETARDTLAEREADFLMTPSAERGPASNYPVTGREVSGASED
jgi:heme exporter protein C